MTGYFALHSIFLSVFASITIDDTGGSIKGSPCDPLGFGAVK